jgi:transposase InsO family protein
MRHKPDTQGTKKYNYICHVIDHFSSFHFIWPLQHKTAEEVANGLKTRVFSVCGLPKILYSDNGLEFKNELIRSLINQWPGNCKVVHGRPRYLNVSFNDGGK